MTPGTKLAEERMAAIFNASRARVREAQLAYEQIVEVYPKKGTWRRRWRGIHPSPGAFASCRR
ncbi:GntR family transcriptional regulator [Pandoraea capi]|uniref:GntR family transcriptional regulator n=1 Tax=Pandoraea capi TaxID=2508286 RepID=UPI001FE887F6|nr:GntR family transcriptional regulator [Pandoraea capi]